MIYEIYNFINLRQFIPNDPSLFTTYKLVAEMSALKGLQDVVEVQPRILCEL